MTNKIVLIFVLTLFSICGYAGGTDAKDVPTAQVEDLNGKKLDFKSMLEPGKFYVVSFWATWCVPCKKELSNMVDLAANWKEKLNTEIIAVSTDDSRAKSKVKTYITGENWPFTILLDQNQDLMRALGIQQIPFTLIIDGNGKIVYTHNSYVEGDEFEIENKLNALKK